MCFLSYSCLAASAAAAGHQEVFAAVEAVLRERYPKHILPTHHTEWIFINAGTYVASYNMHTLYTIALHSTGMIRSLALYGVSFVMRAYSALPPIS